jgi:hypothetical protein
MALTGSNPVPDKKLCAWSMCGEFHLDFGHMDGSSVSKAFAYQASQAISSLAPSRALSLQKVLCRETVCSIPSNAKYPSPGDQSSGGLSSSKEAVLGHVEWVSFRLKCWKQTSEQATIFG